MNELNYSELNKKMWNDRVDVHTQSAMYDVPAFLDGKSSLKDIELAILGDLKGKRVLHLQCHFGMDTLSLARMGAKATGIDFSEKAIEKARELNDQLKLDAHFICADVMNLEELSLEPFDVIFTSYGTVGWLPELKTWGKNIQNLLKPGGRFIFVEFHPVIWMYDDQFSKIEYGYFNRVPIIEEAHGSYADNNADLHHTCVGWNHSITEVLENLISVDMQLIHFKEYDYSPYDIFSNSVEAGNGYMVAGLEYMLPLVYSLVMEKKDAD